MAMVLTVAAFVLPTAIAMKARWACGALGLTLAATLSFAVQPVSAGAAFDTAVPAGSVMAKEATVTVGSRVVKGTQQTGLYLPSSYGYSLKVPTLKGVSSKAQKAFSAGIDAAISSELAFYSKGALTESKFLEIVAQGGGAVSADEYRKQCQANFKSLKGKFSSTVYLDRYVSVVLTFEGLNAPCAQLGGLWVGYQTDRSLTFDVKSAKFKKLTDFTSNSKGQVKAALKKWYSTASHENWDGGPVVKKNLNVCDRPGNMRTVATGQRACFSEPYRKSGLVAWQVTDAGIKLTFPAGDGPRRALVRWRDVPELAR